MVSWLFPQDIPAREQASETYQHGLLKSRGIAVASLMNASPCSPSVPWSHGAPGACIPADAGIQSGAWCWGWSKFPVRSFLRTQESSRVLGAGASPSFPFGHSCGRGNPVGCLALGLVQVSRSVIPADAGIQSGAWCWGWSKFPVRSFLRTQESSRVLGAGASPSWKDGSVFRVGMQEN